MAADWSGCIEEGWGGSGNFLKQLNSEICPIDYSSFCELFLCSMQCFLIAFSPSRTFKVRVSYFQLSCFFINQIFVVVWTTITASSPGIIFISWNHFFFIHSFIHSFIKINSSLIQILSLLQTPLSFLAVSTLFAVTSSTERGTPQRHPWGLGSASSNSC